MGDTRMKRPVVVAIAALLPLVPLSVLSQGVPTDEAGFTEYVAKELRSVLGSTEVRTTGSLQLGVGDLRANLHRIYRFCTKNAEQCPSEVSNYVKAIAEAVKDQNAPPARESVRVIVRSAQYWKQAQAALPAGGSPPEARPLVEGLVLLAVLDSPRTIRMMTEQDNKALGLSSDEVQKLGLENLRTALKPLMEVGKAAGHGQIGRVTGDPYDSSRLALLDSWAPLAEAQGGKLIIAAPAPEAVLYIGEDTPEAIDALRTLVRSIISRSGGPSRMSDELLRWKASGWEVVR